MVFGFETEKPGYEQLERTKKTPEKGPDILDPKKGGERLAAAIGRLDSGKVNADTFLNSRLQGIEQAETKKDLVTMFLERVDSLSKDYSSMNAKIGGKEVSISFAGIRVDGEKVNAEKKDSFKSDLKKNGTERSLDKVTMEFHIDKVYAEQGGAEKVDNTVPVNADALLRAEATGGIEAGKQLVFNSYEGALATFDKGNRDLENKDKARE